VSNRRASGDGRRPPETGDLLLDLRDGRPASAQSAPDDLRRYTVTGRRSVGTSASAAWPAAARRYGSFRALDIPADPSRSCFLLTLTAGSVPLSEARSGSRLEAIHSGTVAGASYCVYISRDRAEHEPPNQRLALLGTRLGWPDLPLTTFTGGALITGTIPGRGDSDVPIAILAAALSAHLLPRPRQSDEAGSARRSRPEESAPAVAGVPLGMEVVTFAGRAMPVEFLITGASVEIWHHKGAAVVARAVLRAWLAHPAAPLVLGSAVFCLDPVVHAEGQVALMLPDVGVWILPPRLLRQLRSRV
jgi:hypothetical protein